MTVFYFVHQYILYNSSYGVNISTLRTQKQFLGPGHTWLFYINGISQDRKATFKMSVELQISGGIITH